MDPLKPRNKNLSPPIIKSHLKPKKTIPVIDSLALKPPKTNHSPPIITSPLKPKKTKPNLSSPVAYNSAVLCTGGVDGFQGARVEKGIAVSYAKVDKGKGIAVSSDAPPISYVPGESVGEGCSTPTDKKDEMKDAKLSELGQMEKDIYDAPDSSSEDSPSPARLEENDVFCMDKLHDMLADPNFGHDFQHFNWIHFPQEEKMSCLYKAYLTRKLECLVHLYEPEDIYLLYSKKKVSTLNKNDQLDDSKVVASLEERIALLCQTLSEGSAEQDKDTKPLILVGYPKNFTLSGDITKDLYHHQIEGMELLWNLHLKRVGGIIADDMGMGKTRQILAFLVGLFESKLIKKVLIVCPPSLLSQWEKECSKMSLPQNTYYKENKNKELRRFKSKDQAVMLTSYGMLTEDVNTFIDLPLDYIVIDEGHAIKNANTKRFKCINSIRTPHRIIITGTPMQNNFEELWTLYRFCDEHLFGDLKSFKNNFQKPLVKGAKKYSSATEKTFSDEAKKKLDEMLKPCFLRRTKQKELPKGKIPIKTELVIWLRLSQCQQDLYRSLAESEVFTSAKSSIPLVLIEILRKICGHPYLTRSLKEKKGKTTFRNDEGKHQRKKLDGKHRQKKLDGKHRQKKLDSERQQKKLDSERQQKKRDGHMLGVHMAGLTLCYWEKNRQLESCKIAFILFLLDDMMKEDHNVLIFSKWPGMLKLIEFSLNSKKLPCLRMDGECTVPQRDAMVEKFQNGEVPILLLTSVVGGVGLNLVKADRVILVDPAWNPSLDNQIVARAHRIGQTRNVLVYRLITCGTVEESVYKTQVYKSTLIRTVTEDELPFTYFTEKARNECFTIGNFNYSTTMKQLSGEHEWKPDATLQQHLDRLRSSSLIAGITNQALLFSERTQRSNNRLWYDEMMRENEDDGDSKADKLLLSSKANDISLGLEKDNTPLAKSSKQVARDRTLCTYGSPGKDEIITRVESMTDSAAGLVMNLIRERSEHDHGLLGNIIGVVALLGAAPTSELSRLFAEYLGDQMLAVVCKSYRDVCLFDIFPELRESINARYDVICLENISPCKVKKDHQGKILLPHPTLPDGSKPAGFLDYAVNLIEVDVNHVDTKIGRGYGLRETLFYRLFGETQVYKSKKDLKSALRCIKYGAVSLDGGIIRGNGAVYIGCLEPDIIFPVINPRNEVNSQQVIRRSSEVQLKTTEELNEKKELLKLQGKSLPNNKLSIKSTPLRTIP